MNNIFFLFFSITSVDVSFLHFFELSKKKKRKS